MEITMREAGYYWARKKEYDTPLIALWFIEQGVGRWSVGGDWNHTDTDFDFISTDRLVPPDMPPKE
jgi:hypothetical protein